MRSRFTKAWVGILFLATALLPALHATVALHSDRSSPFDLAVSGTLEGVPSGGTRYVRYADLRALPTTKLRVTGEFVQGDQEITVVFLSDLCQAMPVSAGTDCLVATCNDLYVSIFPQTFISAYRPFLVVEINGAGPDKWSRGDLGGDPGPYVITVSSRLVPEADHYLALEHKKPWGVVAIEFAHFADKFAEAYQGPWSTLSPRAASGRQLWIDSCASCHAGPGQPDAATKSHLAFSILKAIAQGDPGLVRNYVRHPTSVIATAKMEAHPYYTDEQLDAIIAFITAEP